MTDVYCNCTICKGGPKRCDSERCLCPTCMGGPKRCQTTLPGWSPDYKPSEQDFCDVSGAKLPSRSTDWGGRNGPKAEPIRFRQLDSFVVDGVEFYSHRRIQEMTAAAYRAGKYKGLKKAAQIVSAYGSPAVTGPLAQLLEKTAKLMGVPDEKTQPENASGR